MKTIYSIVLIVLFTFLLVFLNTATAQETQQAPISGVVVWTQNCGSCHVLQPPGRYTKERWKSVITHMKIYARLTDVEANAVLEFLNAGAQSVSVAPSLNNQKLDSTNSIVIGAKSVNIDQLTEEEINELKAFVRNLKKQMQY